MRGAFLGLKGGVTGACLVLALMAVVSVFLRHGWWWYPNLLATALRGHRALRLGPGWATASGTALQIVTGGLGGMLFGVASVPLRRHSRLTVFGLLWGIAWFYIVGWCYRNFTGWISLYAPVYPLMFSYALLGVILARTCRDKKIPESVHTIG